MTFDQSFATRTSFVRRWSAMLGLMAVTLMLSIASGCTADRHTFYSGRVEGRQLSIIDRITGDELWTKDIPVGTKLVVDLDATEFDDAVFDYSSAEPTKMTWQLYRASDGKFFFENYYQHRRALQAGEIALPGTPVLMRVAVLDSDFTAARGPAVSPMVPAAPVSELEMGEEATPEVPSSDSDVIAPAVEEVPAVEDAPAATPAPDATEIEASEEDEISELLNEM